MTFLKDLVLIIFVQNCRSSKVKKVKKTREKRFIYFSIKMIGNCNKKLNAIAIKNIQSMRIINWIIYTFDNFKSYATFLYSELHLIFSFHIPILIIYSYQTLNCILTYGQWNCLKLWRKFKLMAKLSKIKTYFKLCRNE